MSILTGGLCFLCHFITAHSDPGKIPANIDEEDDTHKNVCDKCHCDRMKVRLPNDIDTQGQPITLNYNHHCSQGCGRCIFLKEHHCMFLSACAGYRNIHCFFLFSFYLFITCALHLYLLVMGFYQNDYKYGVTGIFMAMFNKFNPINYYEYVLTVYQVATS